MLNQVLGSTPRRYPSCLPGAQMQFDESCPIHSDSRPNLPPILVYLVGRSNGGRMLPQLSPWDVNGALAKTCEAAAAALQQLLTRELAEWRQLALAVRPR